MYRIFIYRLFKMPIKRGNYNKTSLLAHKEKLLKDIKYYKKRIEDFHAKTSSNTYYENSSDSEDDFPFAIKNEPSVPELKIKQSELRICLQATHELTSLQVLDSEVNVMVEDPVLEGEPPVKGPGSWREVAAECRIDLVPFSIMFYVHQPDGLFAPKSYRGLKVLPVKAAHEAELATSILTKISRPGDATAVLRNYAAAYRSRRTSLAKLADTYANDLFMEPMAEGGYVMKCANLLEVSWRLESKLSSVAVFQHKMKFNLEYMDESYIKIIAQAHKQLSDPTIDTDERTLLLAKIISTCLEAQGPTQELYESMESDPESVRQLEKRRTTLDQDTEAPIPKRKRDGRSKDARESETAKDDQIMAPPKSLPKKTKPKGKENADQNRKSVKRSNVEESTSNVKKAKTNTNVRETRSDLNENINNQLKNDKQTQNGAKTANIDKSKPNAGLTKKNNEKEREKSDEITKEPTKSKNNETTTTNKPQNQNTKKSKKQEQLKNANEEEKSKKKGASNINEGQKVSSTEKMAVNSKNDAKTRELNVDEAPNKNENIASSKNYPTTEETRVEKVPSENKNVASSKNGLKRKASRAEKLPSTNKMLKNDQIAKESDAEKLPTKVNIVASSKYAVTQKPVIEPDNHIQNETSKKTQKKSAIDNKQDKTTTNQEKADKNTNSINNILKTDTENIKNLNKNKTDTLNSNKKANTKEPTVQNTKKNTHNKETNLNKKHGNTESTVSNKDNLPKNVVNDKPKVANAKKTTNMKNTEENSKKDDPKNVKSVKNSQQKNVKTNKIDAMRSKTSLKNVATKEKILENTKQQVLEKVSAKNVAVKTKEQIANRTDSPKVAITTKIIEINKMRNKMAIKKLSHKNPALNLTKNTKIGKIYNVGSNTAKNFNTGNEESTSATKLSKIPQKKFSPISQKIFRNPLRISPRTFPSTFRNASDSNIKQKPLLKRVTNIPRFVKKPDPKLK